MRIPWQPIAGNVITRHQVVLFKRTLERRYLLYRNHSSSSSFMKNMQHCMDRKPTDIPFVYNLADGNARAARGQFELVWPRQLSRTLAVVIISDISKLRLLFEHVLPGILYFVSQNVRRNIWFWDRRWGPLHPISIFFFLCLCYHFALTFPVISCYAIINPYDVHYSTPPPLKICRFFLDTWYITRKYMLEVNLKVVQVSLLLGFQHTTPYL